MTNKEYKNDWVKHCLPAFLLLLMSACGSAPARLPTAIEQAQKADQAAHRALRDGDLKRARELFKQSMLMQQALENIPETAMSAINLSSVNHKLGDEGTALGLLDDVLADKTMLISVELRAAAAFRKGVILADTGKTEEAAVALQLAKQLCNAQCAFVAGMNNLQARLLLDKKEYAAALAIVKGVMNAGAEKEEQANALRLAGAAETALGLHDAALTHYTAALELDKELALSNRIAEDLQGISKSLANLNRQAEAEAYAHRAASVTVAAQKLKGSASR